jgi:sulfite reductase alpha subunit-like flavoprotein
MSPPESIVPMVIVATGSGVATVRGLLEEREAADPEKTGRAILFYGTQSRKTCEPLIQMLEGYKERGVLTDLLFAFSRDTTLKRNYVQDVMQENLEKILEYWSDPEAQFFFSGRGSISDELRDIMIQVLQIAGGYGIEEAVTMNEQHRFVMEVF